MDPNQSIEDARDEIIERVDEIANAAGNDAVSAEATAQVAVTAAALIVAETHDDIAHLEEDTRSLEEKMSWLMKTVESQQQEISRLASSSVQTEITADVAISMAETALSEAQTDSLAPNPSPEIVVSEVVAENPDQAPTLPTDTAQTEPLPESVGESPDLEVGPPILAPVSQVLERKVIML